MAGSISADCQIREQEFKFGRRSGRPPLLSLHTVFNRFGCVLLQCAKNLIAFSFTHRLRPRT
jgi:hypothetical protein